MNEKNPEQIAKAIKVYKANFTASVTPPDCTNCNEMADVYDQCAGENYCNSCLDKSLLEDKEQLFSLTAKFPEMET